MDSAADLIKRDITPFMVPGSEIFRQFFAASSDPNYQEVSQRLVVPKDYDEYEELVSKVLSTGLFVDVSTEPWAYPEEFKDWYKSSETIAGDNPYTGHLANKKWPLKKVL